MLSFEEAAMMKGLAEHLALLRTRVEKLEAEVARLDELTKRRPRGRPRKEIQEVING